MALFPSAKEALALADLMAVRGWGGLSATALAAVGRATGGLDNPIRSVALLAPVWRSAVEAAFVCRRQTTTSSTWRQSPPALAGLVWRVARSGGASAPSRATGVATGRAARLRFSMRGGWKG